MYSTVQYSHNVEAERALYERGHCLNADNEGVPSGVPRVAQRILLPCNNQGGQAIQTRRMYRTRQAVKLDSLTWAAQSISHGPR